MKRAQPPSTGGVPRRVHTVRVQVDGPITATSLRHGLDELAAAGAPAGAEITVDRVVLDHYSVMAQWTTEADPR